ncbi:hypothetical protein WJX81_003571 [Elliptochloris bilobata]|uniref:Fungal lipase-type domain-containing protein n=1 Tax=Elliptochloris bilobata TaxID=381761 RepID=A0AAW1QV20_9CHLO
MRESFLIGYTTVVDNVLATALQVIRADELFYWVTPRLERAVAYITGAWHTLPDGRRVPLSLVNDTAPTLTPPPQYAPRDFPFGDGRGFNLSASHLLALSMRLIYEREEVVQDVAERHWGLRCAGYFVTGGGDHLLYSDPENTAEFNPRTGSAVLCSEQAFIVVFRGTEPTNLINFRSSGRISMSERPGLGRVHDGFFGALFHGDPEAGCLFDRLTETLEAADCGAGRAIYLTGHSLGGALAVVFAAALRQAHPQMGERIGGVVTFGAPRVGDAAFAQRFDDAFGGRAFRVTHGADIIPHVPPRWLEYEHCGRERYITSFGRILADPEAIRRWHAYEAWGFIPFALAKLVLGLVDPYESKLRALYRLVCLLLLPGLSDHFPADYEFKLRRTLAKGTKVEGES